MKKVNCISIMYKRDNKLEECRTWFLFDFAYKLLQVYKNNKFVLNKHTDTFIYAYFYREFPLLNIHNYGDCEITKVETIHSELVKSICSHIFNINNETFNQTLLGGGEFPFVTIYQTDDCYFYNIEQ